MDRFLEKIKKNKWQLSVLIVIIAVGIFLRAYHFSDWLHFELDQAYDAYSVSPAIENGIQNLTLFGTNVGGGTVRLGPAFYYLEYIGAMIFGNTAPGHAAAVLILNIAALPLFYVFCRRYFSSIVSLGLTAIFSFSLFSVLYSRFSWSPNVLPFLTLLSFYTLLRAFSKKEKHPARWFLVSVAAVAISTQIHLNSFFVMPIVALIFTAIKRPRFSWKIWLSALAIIFIIYSPVIASDLKTGGENIKGFKEKVLKTNSVRASTQLQTLIQTVEYNAYENFFIISSNDQINGFRLKDYGFNCGSCKDNLEIKILAIALYIISFLLLLINLIKEKDRNKKDFLIVGLLWLLVSSYLFYTIARTYRMYPRFYLLVSPLAIILYGLVLKYIKPELNKKRLILFFCIILAIVGLNFQKTVSVFESYKNPTINQEVEDADIFPNTNRLTLQEEQEAADYIQEKYNENKFPVYLKSHHNYELPIWFLLEKRGIQYYDDIDEKALHEQGNYFDIRISRGCADSYSGFEVKEYKNFGILTVCYLTPKPQNIISIKQSNLSRKKSDQMIIVSKLLTWKDLFKK